MEYDFSDVQEINMTFKFTAHIYLLFTGIFSMILSTTWSEVILLHFISFVKNTDKDELIET